MNAGVIFRVNNPANGGANDNPSAGTDFLQGYFVGLNKTSVILGKQNYGWKQLKSLAGTYSLNTAYHIKIVTSGANIKVYVTDMTTPKIDYTDPNPIISGKVGFRSNNVHVHFDNLTVTTTDKYATGIKNISNNTSFNNLEIVPNPVRDVLTVSANKKSVAKIYNTTGQLMISQIIEGGDNSINVQQLAKGIYIIKLKSEGTELSRKFIKE